MRGFWRTLESVLAVILLMGFLLAAGSVYFSKTEDVNLGSLGYEILKELDNRGELRAYAVSGDYESLNGKIKLPGYNHSVMICCQGETCRGQYPDSENVAASVYIISGCDGYKPCEVRLFIWW